LSRLRKILHLPATERWILIEAALVLESTRLGLKLLPFRTLRRLVDLLSKPADESLVADQSYIDRIVWAVELAGRHVPGTCLSRALAAQVLLTRRGHPALLHVGVGKERERFLAHAWLESGGRVVIGGHDLERYTPLTTLEGKARNPRSRKV
jgi:hypothetical protein